MASFHVYLVLLLCLQIFCNCINAIKCEKQNTFRNPILDELASDSDILQHEGSYYMVFNHPRPGRIEILKSDILSNFRNATRRVVYTAPDGMDNLWAPKLNYVRGQLYIYFTLDFGGVYDTHRMYVVKAHDPRNPMGNWTEPVRLLPNDEKFATHGNVLEYGDDLYFVFAGISNGTNNIQRKNLYIAKMWDPMTVMPPTVLLKSPVGQWEMNGWPVHEGPTFIKSPKGDRTFMVFTSSAVGSPSCCLGVMGVEAQSDPMVPSNWWNDVKRCVFQRNDEKNVFGPAHPGFVRSPDDSELWLIYDAFDDANGNNSKRRIRIQKMEWEMNAPKFPVALGLDSDIAAPSGEN